MSKMAMRLALRVEGDWWVCYVAKPETMDLAEEIARIRISMVEDQERKQAFMDLCRSCMEEIISRIGATKLGWNDPVAAPEHERAGNA